MKLGRIYVDSSVFGGCFDPEFREDSQRLFAAVRKGIFRILLTEVVLREIEKAPEEIQQVLASLPQDAFERVNIDHEIINLRDAYLSAEIVGEKWVDDATHVAAATVAHADAIISWNFRHIVRLDKIKAYNQVNLLNGYGILTILSPKEVIPYDQEEE